jgi:peptide/nickel transport system substrate-binding protein
MSIRRPLARLVAVLVAAFLSASAVQAQGSVAIPISADPTFNPWHPNAFVESVFPNRVLFAGVTKPGKDLQPAADLASSWSASEDGLTWTFELREDVVWHDGEPFDAEDVAFTFNEIVLNDDLGASGSANFRNTVERVEIVDDSTVQFVMNGAFAALPAYLAYNAGVLPEHVFAGQDPWDLTSFNKGTPIGTGPFKMSEYVSGSFVTLERNDDYFGGAPSLDFITFRVLPDANAQLAQMLAGDLDIMIVDNLASIRQLEASPNVATVPVNQVNYYYVTPHHENPLFQDIRVKRALLHAIDREAIIGSVLQGYGQVATGPISPALEAYHHPDVTTYPYDPERAIELLNEAGWTRGDDGVMQRDGERLSFVLDVGRNKDLEPVSALVQDYWSEIGVEATLNTLEWNAYIQKVVVQRDYDATINWWITPADPDIYAYYHSSAAGTGFNLPGYEDATIDDLLERGRAETNVEERIEIYREFQEEVAEQLPYIFLWYPSEIQARNAALQGVAELGLRDNMHYVHEWSLAQ